MAFIRGGTCNQCGECCGYPRATDGGQCNAWPASWPESVRSWSPESITASLPIMQFQNNMVNTPNGNFTVKGVRCYWIWVKDKGLCTDLPPYGDQATCDQRCPLLMAKQADGKVPCRLVGTRYEPVWKHHCEPVPPTVFENKEQVDAWFRNCPSCSYTYTEG